MSHKPEGKRGRLFWRVYLHGLVMLVAIWVAAVAVGHAFGRDSNRPGLPRRVAAHLAAQVAPVLDEPSRLQTHLDELKEHLLIELSVRDADGALLASTAEPARALTSEEVDRLEDGVFRLPDEPLFIAPLPDGAYLMAEMRRPDVPLERPLTILGVILLLLMLLSIPLARSIAAPLERLTTAARKLGRGDLSVRSGLRRKDEVGVLASAFDEMAGRLETLVHSQKELLANVSHELRTPLSRIRIALELAGEGDVQEAKRYLGEIGDDLEELDQIIEDIFTLARMELPGAAGIPVQKEPVEARAFFERIGTRFHQRHPDRRLDMDAQTSSEVFDADPVLLRRAIENLLDNACKYSDGDVRLSVAEGEGRLEIAVRDRGAGIPPDDLKQLFVPFFRADRSRTRNTGGIGLGLALARSIAEAHGGGIGAESTVGSGSIFRLWLPVRHARPERAA